MTPSAPNPPSRRVYGPGRGKSLTCDFLDICEIVITETVRPRRLPSQSLVHHPPDSISAQKTMTDSVPKDFLENSWYWNGCLWRLTNCRDKLRHWNPTIFPNIDNLILKIVGIGCRMMWCVEIRKNFIGMTRQHNGWEVEHSQTFNHFKSKNHFLIHWNAQSC
jgi:hypothetical protein